MSIYRSLYEEIVRACNFQAPDRFFHKLAGARRVPSTEPNAEWLSAAEETIWPVIYQWHYLRDARRNFEPPGGRTMREREDPGFAARLAEANCSSGTIDPGWVVVGRHGEEYLCEKGGLLLRAAARFIHGTRPNAEGHQLVSIRFPAERRYWMPQYYCTGGGIRAHADFRVYFHLKAECAAWLLRLVTEQLEGAGESYECKLLNNPRSYTRPDAAVLYMPRAALDACRGVVERIAETGPFALRRPVCAFARPLHPGIAVADEPPPGRGRRASFGEHRCRIIARGVGRAYAEDCGPAAERVNVICREFISQGLDPDRPYSAVGKAAVAADF